jgi:hypothetical protein
MLVWVYWIICLTTVTYTSVYIVKKYPVNGFAALLGFYTIILGFPDIRRKSDYV